MSASSKKKLRKEQGAEKLTQKQVAARKEASVTRLYTVGFVVVLALLLATAVFVGVRQSIKNSGYNEKHTVALQIGDHAVSNAELNYYYIDAVNYFYSQYGSYASMFGLDTSVPLDQQMVDEETGRTWADDFLDSARDTAKNTYAMVDAAAAAGYTLPEDKETELEENASRLDVYAKMYGYSDAKAYLKAMYGNGATKESYLEYSRNNALADAYYNYYTDSLTYTDADLRAKEAENYNAYSSYTFQSYYLPTSSFRVGGTTDADGNTTYSDAETAAAEAAVKAAADTLVTDDIDSVEALDAAIAALSINQDNPNAASTANKAVKYSSINSVYQEWVSDSSRKEGDKKVFYSTSSTTDDDGNTTETLSGCHVVYYLGSTDNKFPMVNVRHILIQPTHAEDEAEDAHADGETYSEEELSIARTTAENLLTQWKAGEATEESFATLANENSADGDGTTGGLYENVAPGQMVSAFNDWCFDSSRKPGDTGVVQTDYGFHVMYFVGYTDMTYRDYQIESELRSADAEKWHEDTLAAVTVTDGNTDYIRKDLVLSSN
ncbi:MAG: peptidylprolyl isomerase [Candidatus Faecousia sp.]|nr:peptidylprolyl isomerase [Candidatus Faecousia sp.]